MERPRILAVPWILFGIVLLFSCFLFFAGIGWGVPSGTRASLLHGDEKDRQALVGALTSREEPDGNWIEFNIRQRQADAARRKTGLLGGPGPLDDPTRRAAARSLWLGSASFEENLALASISSMRPRELDFNPRLFQYGGFFLYSAAAFLGAAHCVGAANLVPDLHYYLERPDEIARLYRVGRVLCALAGLLTLWAVFRLARRLAGDAAGVWAAALFAFSPLVLGHAHCFRTHLFALPWAVLALERMVRLRQTGHTRHSVQAGIFLGLAAGSALYHIQLGLALLVAHLVCLRGEDRWKRLGLALAAALAAFAITNPYLVVSWRELMMEWRDFALDFEGRSLLRSGARESAWFLLAVLPNAFGPASLFWVAAGAACFAWRKDGWILTAALGPVLIGGMLRRGQTPEDMAYARYTLLLVPVGAVWAGAFVAHRAVRWRWVPMLFGATFLAVQFPLALAHVMNFRQAASRAATSLEAGRVIRERIPEGADVAFDAMPHPADTPVFDVRRYRVWFAPRALESGQVQYWVLSETCPASWRRRIEKEFEPVFVVEKTDPPLPTLPFRDRFAMANRDFTIYRRKGRGGE